MPSAVAVLPIGSRNVPPYPSSWTRGRFQTRQHLPPVPDSKCCVICAVTVAADRHIDLREGDIHHDSVTLRNRVHTQRLGALTRHILNRANNRRQTLYRGLACRRDSEHITHNHVGVICRRPVSPQPLPSQPMPEFLMPQHH